MRGVRVTAGTLGSAAWAAGQGQRLTERRISRGLAAWRSPFTRQVVREVGAFHRTAGFLRSAAHSRKYRLISVWYGIPVS